MANAPPQGKSQLQNVLDDIRDDANKAYGSTLHCTFAPNPEMDDREVILDYEPAKLSSFRVFCAMKGTILQDPVLFIEQCFITIIFLLCALPMYVLFNSDDFVANRKGAVDVNDWIAKQEPKMRQFAAIMMMLAAFLLSFYTSTSVARWWTMRTGGIGGIKAATMDLEMFISQFVTQEEAVLAAIRRYSRASLTLVFLWRRKKIEKTDIREQLGDNGRKLLTEHEIDKLLLWNHCLHETIWAWQAGIVTMLHKEGKVKSDQLLSLLLQRCSDGRSAVQLLHTHTAVRIPMQYVHLLGLLVKMHNFVLAVIMGILFGAALRNLETVVCLQLFGRTLILPFLFNAIMLINAELADPFNNTIADFPGTAYQRGLEKDGKAFVDAVKSLPDWLAARYRPPADDARAA